MPDADRRALAAPVTPLVPDSELLAVLLREILALHRKVDALAAATLSVGVKGADCVVVADLLRAIVAAVDDHLFTAADLLLRVPPPRAAALRRAVVAAVGAESPRRIGKLLKRYEGLDVGRLTRFGRREARRGHRHLNPYRPRSATSCLRDHQVERPQQTGSGHRASANGRPSSANSRRSCAKTLKSRMTEVKVEQT